MSVQSVNQNLRVYVSPASAAVAPTGGSLFDLNTLSASAGVKAAATPITLTGTTADTYQIYVDGVEITDGVQTFNTTLTQTATDIAADITGFTSSPNYTAVGVGETVVVTADVEGRAANGLTTLTVGTGTGAGTVGTFSGGLGDGIPLGGITYLNKSTQAHVATAPVTVPFQVVYKAMDGSIYHSPEINPANLLKSDLARAAVAPTQQVDVVTVTATASASYVIKLTVLGYGGLLGAQDEVCFYGTHTNPATGGTATTIGDALNASLTAALAKAPVAIATVSNTAGAITVTGVEQPYVTSKFDGRQVNFKLEIAAPEAQWAGATAATSTVPNPGRGNYNQVAAQEEFYAGYSRNFANRGKDFPSEGDPSFAAVAGNTYKSDTFIFAHKDQSANEGSSRQTIICYFQE
jgi:hypothetical protein